jgi:cyclopropane-fatty-acyl-phospholipid synthase
MKLNMAWVGRLPGNRRALKLIRDRILDAMTELSGGKLVVDDPFGRRTLGSGSDSVQSLVVHDARFYPRLLLSGSIGLGESYADEWWDTEDLAETLEFLAANRDRWMGLSRYNPLNLVHSYVHWSNENSLEGSRRNIQEHYDLGNDFYELFLDETMTYSSAYFDSTTNDLRSAQIKKLDRVCEKLGLRDEHTVLEIGSGWGSFAVYAADNYGCDVTTTTISDNQFDYVNNLVEQQGLGDKITVLRKDYRNLDGEYDRIVSLEMIEAVGENYLPQYFRILDNLTKKDGQILLQGIHIRDQFYEDYRRTTDFIQRYIFPGGQLPGLEQITSTISGTSLVLQDYEEIGMDYARTLSEWNKRFQRNRDTLKSMRFDEYFLRLWEYYFAYCEAGFRTGMVGDFQLLLDRPDVLKSA